MEPIEIAELLTEDVHIDNGLLIEQIPIRTFVSLLLESPQSHVYLDLDETLLHQIHFNTKLEKLLANQIEDLTSADGQSDVDEKDTAVILKFQNLLQQYKFKDNCFLIQQPGPKNLLVVLRPGLCNFLQQLEGLKGKTIGQISVYSGNALTVTKQFLDGINNHCGSSLQAVNIKNRPSFDSVLADDDEAQGGQKLVVLGLRKFGNKTRSIHWVQATPFRGDPKDDFLRNLAGLIEDRIHELEKLGPTAQSGSGPGPAGPTPI